MAVGLDESARHLEWQAPYWQVSVVVAVVFTAALFTHLGYEAFGDPESDARLAAYASAEARAERLGAAGETCEQIVLAMGKLMSGDTWRSGAKQKWSSAVSDGQACQGKLADSDGRFDALAQAVRDAGSDPASVQKAADSLAALDDFDRSRKRFQEEASVVAQGEGDAKAVAASDQRLAVLARETAGFVRSRAPADALGVVDALSEITDLDRARSTGSRQQALAAAEADDQLVMNSRAKVSRLGEQARTVQDAPMADNERGLVAAVEAVTPFDEAVATAKEKEALASAHAVAGSVAWTILRQDVAALGEQAAPSDYEAVVVPYEFLKDTPRDTLSYGQRIALTKAGEAADSVAASDPRLAALLKADSVWRQRGVAGGDVVLSALAATTPFDRSRFDDVHKQAWEELSRAAVIVDGPKLGFTASTKDRLLIFVSPSDASAHTVDVAAALVDALKGAGFQVASIQKDAALIAAVTVDGVDDPTTDLSGGFMEWVSTSRIGVRAFWAANEKVLFSGEVVERARAREKGTVQAQALMAGVDAIAERFTKAAER
jgi:hypothetical protein